MWPAIRRVLGLDRRRAFDAAGGGRRWEGAKSVESLNAAILAGTTVAARRAGYYARNNPWVAAAVQALIANAVGTGIKPRSAHPDSNVRDALHRLWAKWTDRADANGLTDFYGLQALALRAMVESGESFARLRVADMVDGLPPLQVELIDREQVPTDLHREIGGGARIRAGIEFDGSGRRVAYHCYRHRPGDALAPIALDNVRVPASDMAHLFQALTPGQLRGITWLAPVLLRLHELDQYEDAALVKAKVAALFTGFIRDPDGTVAGLNGGGAVNGVLQVGMEPGSLIPLPPGADIQFSDPADPGDYGAFVKNHIRAIAAGLGVPYELVSGDLEGVSYSSIRAGLLEFRRRIEQLQYSVIVFQFCRPVWERFVRLAALTGAIDARAFDRDPAAFLACDWLPPKWDWVDPLKDARAEIEQIRAGLKSRSQSIAERGYDIEEVDAAIAADRAREQRFGLSFDTTVSPDQPAMEGANA
ncbi:phage portal protein [Pseudorhodoplanes sp.]|uniref:phage portal protein n=1 Tax=Pseudorhodoplanes sp. TaxID=1934341 RepID=UPI003919E420